MLFEWLAYLVGAQIYWRQSTNTILPSGDKRVILLAAVIIGALIGDQTLHIFEHLSYYRNQPNLILWSGKSILGALIGGTLAVEWAKKMIGWQSRTGHVWVLPLLIGIAIGRLGCQFSGVWDQTYGIPTTLPWGWDYGDQISRHPVGFYEIVLLVVLA